MPRRPLLLSRFKPGDVVIRRHRLLKTQGTIVRFDGEDVHGASRAWVRWNHGTTLPNPSLETVDDLELIASTHPGDDFSTMAPRLGPPARIQRR
jgi:hypothetical protein